MDMDGYAAWTKDLHHGHVHAVLINRGMQDERRHGHKGKTCKFMQYEHGHAAANMQHGHRHEAWTLACRMDRDIQNDVNTDIDM
jgi:hypothetical protein